MAKFRTTRAGVFSKDYILQLGKLTLRRFLMIVLFLDRAKISAAPETIPGGPCLFMKSSKFKTSRDGCNFCEDFQEKGHYRHLMLLGYELKYKQKALDEVDYTVHSLATGLRDGVKLVRLVEILNPAWYTKDGKRSQVLSQQLVCPPDRAQKKHNVNLALDALKSGLNLSGLSDRRGAVTYVQMI